MFVSPIAKSLEQKNFGRGLCLWIMTHGGELWAWRFLNVRTKQCFAEFGPFVEMSSAYSGLANQSDGTNPTAQRPGGDTT